MFEKIYTSAFSIEYSYSNFNFNQKYNQINVQNLKNVFKVTTY